MSLRVVLYQMQRQFDSILPNFSTAHRRNLAAMVVGMTFAQNVRLPEIARCAPISRIQLDSRVQRFERLLDCPTFVPLDVLRPVACRVLGTLARAREPLVLVVDRTMLRDQDNLLFVSVACAGRCVPLGWVRIEHEGTSALDEQQRLLRWAAECLPSGCQAWVVADREFRSIHLAEWIGAELGLHAVVRIQATTWVKVDGAWHLAKELAVRGQQRVYHNAIITKQAAAQAWPKTVVAHWAEDEEEPWLLISDVEEGADIERRYTQRFWTEQMFSDMKSRGLDLERTRMTEPGRIERLLTAVVLAYVWIVQVGSLVISQQRHRRVNNRGATRTLSVCQIGLRWLTEMLHQGYRVPRFTAKLAWIQGPRAPDPVPLSKL